MLGLRLPSAGCSPKVRYGVESAFDYVVGEKLLNFADAAATHAEFAEALPQFVSRVRGMFAPEETKEHRARIERRRRERGSGFRG